MKKLFPYIIKLIEILKPKFYDRITSIAVLSGVSLMTSPLWLVVIETVLGISFNQSITGESDIVWGFTLCCLGLAYHLAATGIHEYLLLQEKKEAHAKCLEHDTAIFEKLEALLSEDDLESIIANVETDDSIYWDDCLKVGMFVRKARSSNGAFLADSIKVKTKDLADVLEDFKRFVHDKFDKYPYEQGIANFRMCLAPKLNCERAGDWENGGKYDSLVQIMMEHTQRCLSDYKEWRLSIKETLFI